MSTIDKRKKFPLLPKVINGGVAGIIGVTCIFPIDLVKTRLQNQQIGPNGEKMYSSIFDCFKKTFAAEGFFGMYRGSAVNIILVTPEKAIKLTANDFFRYHLTNKNGYLSVPRQMVAGGMAGALQIIVTTPMELLKIQMQDAGRIASQAKSEGKQVQKMTALKLTQNLLKERGIFGLYRGIGATAARDVSFSIFYFPMFAILNDMGPKKEGTGEAKFWWSFVCGCTAGCVCALLVTPFDVIKTRLQLITKGEGERVCHGIIDCAKSIMKYEGPKAFFKGGVCRMMVLAPLFGIAQAVYYIGIGEFLLGYK